MTLRPSALDYDELFPTNRQRARDKHNSDEDSFSSKGTSKKAFSDDQTVIRDANTTVPDVVASSPGNEQSSGDPVFPKRSPWIQRRGHTLSFIGLFVFSVVLYLRPYELFPGLSSLTSMAFFTGLVTLLIYAITQLSTEGNLTARPKEINLVLMLGGAAILSMPMAVDIGDAWKTFSEQLLKTIVIFVVLVNVVRTELRLKLLLLLVLAVSIYLSVNAINDYRLGIFDIGVSETARIRGRIKGLFENSNDLALHLVTMIPIAVALGISKRDPFRKLIYLGAGALMVAGVIVTFSRGGFIGLVAAALVLVRRLGRKNRVATTTAMVFAVIMFLSLAPGAYSGRLSSIFDSAADLTGSSSQRNEVLKQSVWVTLRYPVLGVGIGNFHHKSPRNLETHNAYTQVGSEMGLAAMAIYIMFLIYPLRRLRAVENQSYSKPEQIRFFHLSIGLQASLVGFMASSFFGAVAYQWYVYYLVAYAVCLHRIYLMKHGLGDDLEQGLWEHPFAKKRKKLGTIPVVP